METNLPAESYDVIKVLIINGAPSLFLELFLIRGFDPEVDKPQPGLFHMKDQSSDQSICPCFTPPFNLNFFFAYKARDVFGTFHIQAKSDISEQEASYFVFLLKIFNFANDIFRASLSPDGSLNR